MADPMEMPEKRPGEEPKNAERPEARIENVEATAEAVDTEIDDATKSLDGDAASMADFGDSEFARVTSDTDMSMMGPDEARGIQESKKEIDAIAAEGRSVAESLKARLGAVSAKVKRFGRVVAGAAILSSTAMSPSEAAPVPDRSQKEQGEKKLSPKEAMAEKLKGDKNLREDLLKRFSSEEKVEAIEQELTEAFTSWDEERTRRDLAALAGLDASEISSDVFKKISVLSEVDSKKQGLTGGKNAEAKDDNIFFRAKKLVDDDGNVDVARVHHTMDHEKGHVLTTTGEKHPISHETVSLWEKAGVPQELNEGVTELLALRAAERRGEKQKDQSYAGGNLIAARLLEGVVGTEAMAKDYLKGTTDSMKKNFDAQFGPGAFESIMAADFPPSERGTIDGIPVDRPEGLAKVLDIIRVAEKAGKGDAIDKIWKEAKDKDGFKEDMRITPDRRGIILVKETGDAEAPITASGVFEDTDPVSPSTEPVRVFVWSNLGDPPSEKKLESIVSKAAINDEIEMLARGNFEKMEGFKEDAELQKLFREELADKRNQAVWRARGKGVETDNPNIIIDMRNDVRPIVEAFGKTTSRETKTELSAKLQQETERIGRETMTKVKEGMRKAREKKTPPAK